MTSVRGFNAEAATMNLNRLASVAVKSAVKESSSFTPQMPFGPRSVKKHQRSTIFWLVSIVMRPVLNTFPVLSLVYMPVFLFEDKCDPNCFIAKGLNAQVCTTWNLATKTFIDLISVFAVIIMRQLGNSDCSSWQYGIQKHDFGGELINDCYSLKDGFVALEFIL